MRKLLLSALLLAVLPAAAQVRIFPGEPLGPVKNMHAVNNGPVLVKKSQTRSNMESWRAARIPYARTHDTALYAGYGGHHAIDISAIFPDFAADVNSPASYDFKVSDAFIANVYSAGTEIFFRLGQSIENWAKKYDVWPPKDYKKWARICEHIIMHYNDGWADGFHYGIQYWEIWNEADLDQHEKDWKTAPRTWGGSPRQFFEFFEVAAKYLDKRFPVLKIGGPALCGSLSWAEDFLAYMQSHKVPMDFFSWHIYASTPERVAKMSSDVEALMNRYGYGDAESIINEWNYLRDWSDNFVYTLKEVNDIKGAAFCAAVMSTCQDARPDMLMYYDARPGTGFCGLYDATTLKTNPAYYAFYMWSRLKDYGTQVRTAIGGEMPDVYATAARQEEKGLAVMLCRFNDDDNVSAPRMLTVDLGGAKNEGTVYAHITDSNHLFTEIPLEIKNGRLELLMAPESFVFIEIR
ncbi:MAG: hypothetical protein IJS07_05160 [Bacteroidales bacterium]|nr:hypothetical protein [Bacteroidales bacterium]